MKAFFAAAILMGSGSVTLAKGEPLNVMEIRINQDISVGGGTDMESWHSRRVVLGNGECTLDVGSGTPNFVFKGGTILKGVRNPNGWSDFELGTEDRKRAIVGSGTFLTGSFTMTRIYLKSVMRGSDAFKVQATCTNLRYDENGGIKKKEGWSTPSLNQLRKVLSPYADVKEYTAPVEEAK